MRNPLLMAPTHLRQRLIGSLRSGMLEPPYSLISLRSVLGGHESLEQIRLGLEELERLGIHGPGAAAWIEAVDEASAAGPAIDLVWSGPEVPGLHARDTRRVFEELLGSATRSLWISTFAFFDGPRAFDVLARRMESTPGLSVTLLLNIQRARGDSSSPEQLAQRFAERFWRKEWPGAIRPKVYYDPRSLALDGCTGVLHAKAVVADEEAVFVTSANLTEAALDRNFEVGLLVRDRALAASLASHFKTLIERRMLGELPR